MYEVADPSTPVVMLNGLCACMQLYNVLLILPCSYTAIIIILTTSVNETFKFVITSMLWDTIKLDEIVTEGESATAKVKLYIMLTCYYIVSQ